MTNIQIYGLIGVAYFAGVAAIAWLVCRARPLTREEIATNHQPIRPAEDTHYLGQGIFSPIMGQKVDLGPTGAYQEYLSRRTLDTAPPLVPPRTGESSPASGLTPPEALKTVLLITGCSDSSMWYAGLIGQEVPYLGTWKSDRLYKSREPAGYVNIVKFGDARLVVRSDKC